MRIAVKLSNRRYVLLDPAEVYYLEGEGHDTRVRTARKTRLRSVRNLGQLESDLAPHGFLRVHLDRIREVRLRAGDDNDRERKLDPPVIVVLPVRRRYVAELRERLGF